MSKDRLNNVVASVRQRLANIAQTNGDDFNLLLTPSVKEPFHGMPLQDFLKKHTVGFCSIRKFLSHRSN